MCLCYLSGDTVSNMKSYDIILAHTNHRAHEYHLNIVKALSGECSIGILPVGRENKRLDGTARFFLDLCREFGAEIVTAGERCRCAALLAAQYDYDEGAFDGVDCETLVILPRFSSGKLGLDKLKKRGAREIWVYERNLFLEVLKGEGREDLLEDLRIVEMGAPYEKHPAFDFADLKIDWLVAYPTPMLIRDTRARFELLDNIRSAIRRIPKGENVYVKLHNVKDGGYGMGSGLVKSMPGWSRRMLDFFLAILAPLNWILSKILPWDIHDVRARIRDADIMNAAILLSERTPFHNLGIEHFLPFAGKGLLTGISACEWHALYDGVPVLNLDSRPLTEETPNYHAYKLFHAPFRGSDPASASADYAEIPESAENADLIELVKRKLERKT